MGNFVGHMDEAIVFYLLCLWWMYKGFTNYFKAVNGRGKFRLQMSYMTNICGKAVPIEQTLKIIFPLSAVIGELYASGLRFTDENGQAAGIKYQMHMTIFGMFALHGVVDLLVRLKVSWVHPKMDLLSGFVAFLWYGMGLYYHIKPTKPAIENSLHLLLTRPVFLMSLTLLLATVKPSSFLLDFIRCYCMSLMATWTTHTAFMLYKPGFLGLEWNQKINFYFEPNRDFVPVAFGMHLAFNFIFMLIFYAACYCMVNWTNSRQNIKYSQCHDEDDATESLLEN